MNKNNLNSEKPQSHFMLRLGNDVLLFVVLLALVLTLHFPILRNYINYGDRQLTEMGNSRKFYQGDNLRYFIHITSLLGKNFKEKFSSIFYVDVLEVSRFQAEAYKYKDSDFPKYYNSLSRLYAYPSEKVGYTYTGAVVSSLFPKTLFDYKIPRLVLVNVVLYILVAFILFKIFNLYFGRLLSLILTIFSIFDVCLVYVSYDYNSPALCGIFYFLILLYLFFQKKENNPVLVLNIKYFLLGFLITLAFLSSNYLFIVFVLGLFIFLDLLFLSQRFSRKIFYFLSFCFGLAAIILFFITLENMLGFRKYGIFTFMDTFLLYKKGHAYVHFGLPNSPPIFILYNYRYHNDLKVVWLFCLFFVLGLLLKKRIASSKNRGIGLSLISILKDPIFILSFLLLTNFIFVPLFKLLLANRFSSVNNLLITLIACFIIGRLSKSFLIRRGFWRILFIILLTGLLFLSANNFYYRFDKTKYFDRGQYLGLYNAFDISDNKEMLSNNFNMDFYNNYLAGKYKYICFDPRSLYEEIAQDLFKKTKIDQISYAKKYLFMETMLKTITEKDQDMVKIIQKPMDSATYGLGYLNFEYYSYCVLMGLGQQFINRLQISRLNPNKIYFFNIEKIYQKIK